MTTAEVPDGPCPVHLAADGPLITLRADRSLDYGRVMAVMGELNRGSCNSISLVTQGSVEAP